MAVLPVVLRFCGEERSVMRGRLKLPQLPRQSFENNLRSIGRRNLNAVTLTTLLVCAAYLTVSTALERHSLQQNISFLTNQQFIRFQQLAIQTNALLNASEDPRLPEYAVAPLQEDVQKLIWDIRANSLQLENLELRISRNLLERFTPPEESIKDQRANLEERLSEFLGRATRIARATIKERRERYTLWWGVDFAAASDSMLMRAFRDLIRGSNLRSEISILNARLIASWLLALIAASVVISSLLLFRPLLKKLREEHKRSIDFEKRMTKLALTDALTDLSNRSSFNQTLVSLFNDLDRTGQGFSLLVIDLDHFKRINDTLGHPAGDAVLRHVASALRKTVRSCDIPVRLGGDEFAVLLPGVTDAGVLAAVADRIGAALATELVFNERTLYPTASIGGAVVPAHALDETSLLRVVDLALYEAKNSRNAAIIFNEVSLAQRLEQNQMVLALALAADREEFVVHYQAKVRLSDGKHQGFEALVRWRHPQQGLLAPARFLSLMEGTPLIQGMTRSVVAAVGRDLANWKRCGLCPGPVAINLPEVFLVSDQGYAMFARAIAENGLMWSDFAVEITEDVFLNRDADVILDTVTRFRENGLSVSLDDFGTGFASLVHLRDFPCDELKIDRSFVSGIGTDARSEQIVRAMIDLARNLGKRCVAEGIETDSQRRFLAVAGCEIGQGFLFNRPEPVEGATKHLQQLSNLLQHGANAVSA